GSSDWTGGVDFFGGHTPAEANQVCGSTANTQAYSLLNGTSAVNNGKHLVFKLSTADYEDIVLTYSTRGTANGFDTHTWAYSTDGVAFTDVSTITGTNNTTFSTKTVDFSSNTAINNQSDVYIRLTLSGAGTQNSQNNRLDNIKFVGTEVESSTPGYCTVSTTDSIDYISAFSTTGGIQNLSYSATEQPAGSYANETAQIVEQAQGLSIDFSTTYEGGS